VIDCAAVVVHAHREALGSTGENAIKNARAKREAIRKLSLAYDNAKANDREQP
jgi:GTP-sensing pleiotropic transcriptional regulator CodY